MPPTPTFATYPTTVAAILEFQRSRSLPRLMREARVMSGFIFFVVGMFVRVLRTLRACTDLIEVSPRLGSQGARAAALPVKEIMLAMSDVKRTCRFIYCRLLAHSFLAFCAVR